MKHFFKTSMLLCALWAICTAVRAEIASGTNGSLTWTISDDGVFSINGTGPMTNPANSSSAIEWYHYMQQIKVIEIGYGVTQVCAHAFSYASNVTEVVLPLSLTNIGTSAFRDCTGLKTLTLPSGLTSIGIWGFRGCTGLEQITCMATVPPSMVMSNAFSDYTTPTLHVPVGYKEAYAADAAWGNFTSIVDDAAISYLYSGKCGDNLVWSFADDGTLTIDGTGDMSVSGSSMPWAAIKAGIMAVVISEGATSISSNAFKGCTLLKTVALPTTMKSIGSEAFFDCSSLTSVNIPASVASLGTRVFASCPKLEQISVESGNSVYDSRVKCNAIVETATNRLLTGCVSTIIPHTVTAIADDAFYGSCGSKVDIPEGVKSIGKRAFYGCSMLRFLFLPATLGQIGEDAFHGCSLDYVANNSDTPIAVSASVLEPLCSNTQLLVHKEAYDAYKADASWSKFKNIYSDGPYSGSCGAELSWRYWPSAKSLQIFGSGKMDDFGMARSSNGPYASPLKSPWAKFEVSTLSIEEGVTSISSFAFQDTNVSEVTLPSTMWEIATCAFAGTKSLKSIVIPKSVMQIGSSLFGDMGGCQLQSIVVEEGNQLFDSRENCNAIINKYTNELIAACLTTTIPESVTSIGTYAFYNLKPENPFNLSNVKQVGYRAFCRSKVSNAMGRLETINTEAFARCEMPDVIDLDSLSFLGDNAFRDVPNLKSVNLGHVSVISGGNQFSVTGGASQIRDIYIKSLNPPTLQGYVGSMNSAPMDLSRSVRVHVCNKSVDAFKADPDWGSFYNYVVEYYLLDGICGDDVAWTFSKFDGPGELTINGLGDMYDFESADDAPWIEIASEIDKISVGEGVTSVGDYAFACCSNLKDVTMKNTVKEIGVGAFKGCKNLAEIAFPDGLQQINNYAFSDCSGLTNVVLPNGITRVGMFAFAECVGLKSLVIPETLASIGTNAFRSDTNLKTIYNHALVPQTITYTTFATYSATLHVCNGLKGLYAAATNWKDFTIVDDIALPYQHGDANGDGNVDVVDITAIASHILGDEPEKFNSDAADISQDGAIDVIDISLVASAILGL
ncbi:MAG: leucine-rich repeat protein [Prevotellaceae bacterium]|nr:leucine-rich repeat protein [Candidatus Colivivens caballi]